MHRCARRRARLALDGPRIGRALCSGRDGELSVLGADERRCRRRSPACRGSSWSCRRRAARLNPLVLAAARLAGVDEIYRIGGAQAVAALAYGTATIAPVAKIVGPGNAYVAAAKRRVFGQVGIDMIAGPSEVLIVADRDANPDWIAADLLAQAEHDAAAQAILDHRRSRRSPMRSRRRSSDSFPTLPRGEIAARELARFRRDHPRSTA